MNTAVFSPDRFWRYTLTRELGVGPTLMVIGLNPSTADETQDDPTIRRLIGYARRWECGRLIMTNLFALRSTDPRALYAHTADVVGEDNDVWLRRKAGEADMVLAAWGNHGRLMGRSAKVIELLSGKTLWCLGRTGAGEPKHPLYLRADLEPEHFAGPVPDPDAAVHASEAYLVDLPRPLKRAAFGDAYREHERRLMMAVGLQFELDWPEPESVKIADNRLLVTEQRDLMGSDTPWMDIEPLPDPIRPIGPVEAKDLFLNRFRFLTTRAAAA